MVDIGGTHVKASVSSGDEVRTFDSGTTLTPESLVSGVRELVADWDFAAISIGYPGKVDVRGPRGEPGNLGQGWVGFDFSAAFGRPVRVANDAVMQALGAYRGGRMLFLGLGTGLGSAFVVERVVVPLELGNLPWTSDRSLGDTVGKKGRAEFGDERWLESVHRMVEVLAPAFSADYVTLGGGNAKHVEPLPERTHRGGNRDAFVGGVRLWEEMVEPHDRSPDRVWRVVS